MRIHKVVVDGL